MAGIMGMTDSQLAIRGKQGVFDLQSIAVIVLVLLSMDRLKSEETAMECCEAEGERGEGG
jgi:hypothetical protein